MLKAVKVPPDADPIVTWAEITEGIVKPTACQAFRALWFEMRRRYKKGTDGKFIGGTRITLIADEFNFLANLPGLRKIWLELVREARKVGISLILIVQNNDVTSLNIEGQGGIRENLVQISFGSAAEDVIMANISLAGDDKVLRDYWLSKLREYRLKTYKVMVEDMVAELPAPGSWVKPGTAKVAKSTATVESGESKPDWTEQELLELHQAAKEAANQGLSKTKIITKVWKMSFSPGSKLWRRLETELGVIMMHPQQLQDVDEFTEDKP
jgi:hypothetical protein